MKYFVKVVLILAASVAGLGLGYLAGAALLPRLLMLIANEPTTNIELYNSFRDSMPVVFASLAFGAMAAYGLGYWAEQTLNRHGLFGLFGWGGEEAMEALVTVRLEMTFQEEGGEPQRCELFKGNVAAGVLARFFQGEPGTPLALAHPRDPQGRLRLVRLRPGPYCELYPAISPLLITLRDGRKTLHCFESTAQGKYSKPENKDRAFCRYEISHRGVEDVLEGALKFEGDPDVMSAVFLGDEFADG